MHGAYDHQYDQTPCPSNANTTRHYGLGYSLMEWTERATRPRESLTIEDEPGVVKKYLRLDLPNAKTQGKFDRK